ncbi:hypothetical protein [Naasia sp. SYSU D00057]|uniref:hypothetical protein n=1 Tax=Naasia sp. SYSU D00057 TaxID=2817380 RepID=UPI001B3052C0|nr:hypothetical protein [Naasia sp. SYSU D00057]
MGLTAIRSARAAGLEPRGWIILTHLDGMSADEQRFAVRDAWGSPSPFALCPSHPEVRAFGLELIRHTHRTAGVTVFQVEALMGLGFEHLVAHDKVPFAWLGRRAVTALSLCFCTACTARATEAGIDLAAIAERVRSSVSGDPGADDLDDDLLVARAVRTGTGHAFAAEIAALGNDLGLSISVAGTTDPAALGSYAPLVPAPPANLTPYAFLSAASGQGWRDVTEWSERHGRRVGGVVEMLPAQRTVAEALAAGGEPGPVLALLDDLYLYHLGQRRPDTLDLLHVDDVRSAHRPRKDNA